MKFFGLFPLLILISACQSIYHEKNVIIVKQFDKTLSLTRDKHTHQLYFQSKNSEPKGECGKYWYSDTGGYLKEYQRHETNLNNLIDINSLVVDKIIANEYYLHDKSNQYTIILTLCDNQVSYQKTRE